MLVGGLPLPSEPVRGGGWKAVIARIEEMKRDCGLELVVLGLPLASGGRPTELSVEIESLAGAIRELGMEVVLVPERGSTAEAKALPVRHARRTGRTDSLAAVVLLERYTATS